MIELKPFTKSDFTTFKQWIKNEKELFQFAGPLFTFPLTDDQLEDYIRMSKKKAFKVMLTSSSKSIGHCEINTENGKTTLCRILIGDKTLRGQKIGEKIVLKMLELALSDITVQKVYLNVFEWNKNAIRCYEKVGFKINHEGTSIINMSGEDWNMLNMVFKRKETPTKLKTHL